MKTSICYGALATLTLGLAACSSDEPVVNPDNPATGGEQFMAVTIQTVGDGTRALPGDTDFEQGVGNENSITAANIRFYFFTETGAPFVMSHVNVNGTVTNTNMVQPTEIKASNLTNGEEPTDITGILVLGTPDPEAGYQGNTPARVIAVANPKARAFEEYANISITQFQEKSASLNNFDFNTFTMTSSSYVDGVKQADGSTKDEVVCYTDVSGKIKTTKDEAEKDAAMIYMERLAAKVRVHGLGTYNVKVRDKNNNQLTNENFTIWESSDGATRTTLQVELQGWQLMNRAHSTYALKNITDFVTNPPFADWNDPTRHRSYWAFTNASADTDFSDTEYKLYGDQASNYFKLGEFDSTNATANIAYTYGNTRPEPASVTDRETKATAIMVKAQVQDSDGNPVDLVKWGAEYFTLDYFKQVVANAWNGEGGIAATKDDVTLITDGTQANTYKVKVKNSDFSRFSGISWWKNGLTTYNVNILHHTDAAGKNYFGVVRNHIYDYTFTAVIGLGVPGEDPVNPPVPTETYLAAAVNVLNWHIVSHDNTVLGE